MAPLMWGYRSQDALTLTVIVRGSSSAIGKAEKDRNDREFTEYRTACMQI